MGVIGNFFLIVASLIGGAILAIVNFIFGSINVIIPDGFSNAITYFFSYFTYLRGIFPVDTLMEVFGVVMVCWVAIYLLKLFMHTLFPLVPFLGKRIELPKHKK